MKSVLSRPRKSLFRIKAPLFSDLGTKLAYGFRQASLRLEYGGLNDEAYTA